MVRGLVLAAVLAFAQEPEIPMGPETVDEIAPPASMDDSGILDWVQANFLQADLVFAGSTPEGAYLIDLSTVQRMSDGVVRFWVRIENFAPRPMENIGLVRSSHTLHEVDCEDLRTQMLARDYYGRNRLQGATLFGTDLEGGWSYIRPGSMSQRLADEVCARVAERPGG